MSTIVREHYPVAALPEDLRVGLPEDGWVRISLETDGTEPGPTDEMRRTRLDAELAEGVADLEAGRARSLDDVRRDLRARHPLVDAAE